MRGDQLSRQWRILRQIEASKYGLTAAEIAELGGVSLKTGYRDLDDLQLAGFPLYTVKIWISPAWSRYIGEKIWHESQQIRRLPDGSLEITCRVAGLEEIKQWVMGMGTEARVLEPASLKELMKAELHGVLSYYTEPIESHQQPAPNKTADYAS